MNRIDYRLFFTILFLSVFTSISGQIINSKKVNLNYIDSNPNFKIKLSLEHSASQINNTLKKQFFNQGFLGFSVDTIIETHDSINFFLFIGERYQLKKIILDDQDFSELNKKFLFKKNLSTSKIAYYDREIHDQIINMGYPYSTISREYSTIKSHAVLNYQIQTNQLVKFDSIKTIPNDLISYHYLSRKTGIRHGDPYNSGHVKEILNNINQTKLFLVDSIYSSIIGTKASNLIKLKPIKQNTFSALVGLQNGKDDKAELTGNASLKLVNAFKNGELIYIDWLKPGSLSQLLSIEFKYPYIPNLPVGVGLSGKIDKQDSTFTNSEIKTSLYAPSVNYGEFSVFVKLINSATGNTQISEIASTETKQYGFGYYFSRFDNPFIPKKGFEITTELYLGNQKQFKPNSEESNYALLEAKGEFVFALPMPLGSLYFNNTGSFLISDSLKRNNLYRLGGVNSIRGFNEKSIYSKQYIIFKSEYRLYLNRESFAYILNDFGYLNVPVNNTYKYETKHAIGIGMHIKTTAGNLKISYALGRSINEAFQINQGKIHIGYINRF